MARPTDSHLSQEELEGFLASSDSQSRNSLSPECDSEGISFHIANCEQCRFLAANHTAAQTRLASLARTAADARQTDCPPDDELRQLAAGLLPTQHAEKNMQHAANCDHCGPFLRATIENFKDDLTADEELILRSLKSGTQAWQLRLASRLGETTNTLEKPIRFPTHWLTYFSSWPRLVLTAASILLIVFASWRLFRPQPEITAEQLIGEAYTQQRPFEPRIAGARHVPIRSERGRQSSSLSRPAALLEVEPLIAKNLAAHPDDPIWLQARGRAELLDGEYSAALESFQHALRKKPDDAALLIDLSTAHFQRAEIESLPREYGVSIELLSRVLSKEPDDPIALFNRAIVSDRLFLYEQEEQDWQHYLRIDPAGDWANEASQHLADLRTKKKGSLSEPLAKPDPKETFRFLESRAAIPQLNGEPENADLKNSVDENYLAEALTEWLPNDHRTKQSIRNESPPRNYRTALVALARVLKNRHGDDWLADVLSIPDSPTLEHAFGALASSINSNSIGDPSSAEVQSRQAETLFRATGAKQAALRARLEIIYSLHRAQLPTKCLLESPPLLAELSTKNYPWMKGQLLLEIASCYSMIERLDLAAERAQEALSVAINAGYGALWLRSIGIRATIESNKGNFAAAWSLDLDGLQKYWAGSYPVMRGYQFYSDLGTSPQQENLNYLALALARQAVILISSSEHRAFEAMARYQLAALCGTSEEAIEQYGAASRLFSTLPQTPSTRIYRLNSDLSLAEIEVARARYSDALPRLRAIQPELSDTSNETIALRYYLVAGHALLESGEYSNAETNLRSALRIATRKLDSLTTDRDRMAWEREAGRAARLLAFLYFEKKNDAITSLDLWESYRLQPRAGRTGQKVEKRTDSTFLDRRLNSSTRSISNHLDSVLRETVISYAVFPTGIAIWVFDNRGIHSKWVAVSEGDLNKSVKDFVALCSTPSLDLANLHRVGAQLYQWLISPVVTHFEPGRVLIFEPDGSISKVPLQALTAPSGDYLGQQFLSLMSPRFCLGPKCRLGTTFSVQQSALVVGAPALPSEMAIGLPSLPNASLEAADVAQFFPSSTLLAGSSATLAATKRDLPRFAVFHFAGHALASGPQRGLLLAPADSPNKHVGVFLDAKQLRDINLHANRLVVLSACSTGVDAEEGLADPDNLLRSFFRAGASRVVASRWNVDSTVAAEFMHAFYGSLLDQGSLARALGVAEATVRNDRRTSHPYYWAVFGGFVTQ